MQANENNEVKHITPINTGFVFCQKFLATEWLAYFCSNSVQVFFPIVSTILNVSLQNENSIIHLVKHNL